MNTNRHYPACFARFAWYVLVCCIVPNAARAGDFAQNFAVVEKILPTAQGAVPRATLLRDGKLSALTANVTLQGGDEIETDAHTRVLMRFTTAPVQVALGPDSQARIGSLFLNRGQALIRKLKGYFGVETEFGTAASESTEYLVSVSPARTLSVIVLEGTVKLTPKDTHGQSLETTLVMPSEEAVVTLERRTMRGAPSGNAAFGAPRVSKRPVSNQRLEAIRGLFAE